MGRAIKRSVRWVGIFPCFLTIAAAGEDVRQPCRTAFDDKKAAERAQEIAGCYVSNYDEGLCPYYGRLWRAGFASTRVYGDTRMTVWEHYRLALKTAGLVPKQLDCTLYAQEILKAGMSRRDYTRLREEHRKVWGERGFAGWSVGYLLVEKLGWHAYAIVAPDAPDLALYTRSFKSKKAYPVWRQPAIPIEGYFVFGRDDAEIEALLQRHAFGWGFSEGGIHTWITEGVDLKECHFDSGPTRQYDDADLPHRLLETTRFTAFKDYHVHLVVFPSATEGCDSSIAPASDGNRSGLPRPGSV